MLKTIRRAFKIVAIGGTVVAAGAAYKIYSQNHQTLIDSQNKQKIANQIKQQLDSRPQIKLQHQLGHQRIIQQQGQNIAQSGKQAGTKQQQTEGKAQIHRHHKHDQDIRVLDMVGFPAVRGANILEKQQQQQKPKNKTKQQQQKNQLESQPTTEQQQPQQPQKPQKPQQKIQIPEPEIVKQEQTNAQIKQTKQQIKQIEEKRQQLKQPLSELPASKIEAKAESPKVRQKKTYYSKISQIPQLKSPEDISSADYVMIVADLPYNQAFQKQIINKVTNVIKKRQSSQPLKIYRTKINQPNAKNQLVQRFGAKVRQQTILLLKNPYENKLINIDFDMFIQNPRLPPIYLSELKIAQRPEDLQKQLTKMTPNDTYILLLADMENDPEIYKKKLTAKYIQMQMGINNIENTKIYLVDEKIAKEAGVVSQQTKPNSLHLIRKSNQFTFKSPNRWLFNNIPFHVFENISLYDRERTLLIPRYLSKVETFNSMKVDAPFMCSITIDRNRTNPKQQRQMLRAFSHLKQSGEFPNVSFILKFGQTQYRGEQEDPFSNKKFAVKLINLDEIDRHLLVHQVKNKQDAEMIGIKQKNWLKGSYQYLYREPEVTEQGLKKFISRSLSGQQPQFYKTQAKFKLENVDKLTGNSYQQKIFGNNKSHIVFQYSDHCQTCQLLSPVIDYFNDVCNQFPDLRNDDNITEIQVHALNCQKNKVKGQPYSPYTPNMYFYSRKWKNRTPIRYPLIEYINHTNVWGIYDFCTITDALSPIQLSKFDEHIQNVKKNGFKLSQL